MPSTTDAAATLEDIQRDLQALRNDMSRQRAAGRSRRMVDRSGAGGGRARCEM